MQEPDRFSAAADRLKSWVASESEDFPEVRGKVVKLLPSAWPDVKPKNGYLALVIWAYALVTAMPSLETPLQDIIPWSDLKGLVQPPDSSSQSGETSSTSGGAMDPPPRPTPPSSASDSKALMEAVQVLTSTVASLQRQVDELSLGKVAGSAPPQSPGWSWGAPGFAQSSFFPNPVLAPPSPAQGGDGIPLFNVPAVEMFLRANSTAGGSAEIAIKAISSKCRDLYVEFYKNSTSPMHQFYMAESAVHLRGIEEQMRGFVNSSAAGMPARISQDEWLIKLNRLVAMKLATTKGVPAAKLFDSITSPQSDMPREMSQALIYVAATADKGVSNKGTAGVSTEGKKKCHQCGRLGHVKADCRSKGKQGNAAGGGKK